MNDPMQMYTAFNQFKSQLKGNARQTVQQLVASGKMSQKQLNQLQAEATNIFNMFTRMGFKF